MGDLSLCSISNSVTSHESMRHSSEPMGVAMGARDHDFAFKGMGVAGAGPSDMCTSIAKFCAMR